MKKKNKKGGNSEEESHEGANVAREKKMKEQERSIYQFAQSSIYIYNDNNHRCAYVGCCLFYFAVSLEAGYLVHCYLFLSETLISR